MNSSNVVILNTNKQNMKKSNSLLISLLFLFTVMVDAAKTDSTMFELESRSGVDGRMVFFPSNWKTSMGVDGGMVSLFELL